MAIQFHDLFRVSRRLYTMVYKIWWENLTMNDNLHLPNFPRVLIRDQNKLQWLEVEADVKIKHKSRRLKSSFPFVLYWLDFLKVGSRKVGK